MISGQKLFVIFLAMKLITIIVAFECPDPGSSSVVEYIGSPGISMSQVMGCVSVNRGKSLIVVQSFSSIQLPLQLEFPNFNDSSNTIQPSLLIITPVLGTQYGGRIFLNGVNVTAPEAKPEGQGRRLGKPGKPGGTAGSLLLVFREQGPYLSPTVYARGGDGQDGQEGQDGRDGANGSAKVINATDNAQCSAWSDGWTRVWLSPSRCHEKTDNDGRCYAGSADGARWEIYGEEGERGEDGNDGGAAGIGGKGGTYLLADIGRRQNSTVGRGVAGKNGVGGKAGKPGQGGKTGDTLLVTVAVNDADVNETACEFVNGPLVKPVEKLAEHGTAAQNGNNSVGQMQPVEPFELMSFRPYIASYVNRCYNLAIENGDAKLMKFCKDVETHFAIDNVYTDEK